MQNPSMNQLAQELGVSKALVSLALSGKYGVNEDMRARIVLYAIQRGYDFSRCRTAKGKSPRINTIGVFLNQNDLLAERFWPQILKGIESELYLHSIKMKVVVWNGEEDCERAALDLVASQYEGLIILNELPQKTLDHLAAMGFRIVVVDGKRMYESQFDTVRANNYAGGYTGVQYLVRKGHKRLLFVGYADFSRSFKERYHGFMDGAQAMRDPELRVMQAISAGTEPEVFSADLFDYIYNKQELLACFADREQAPTAIMCANDPIAIEVMRELGRIGVRIPEDASVLGFDDIRDSQFCSPRLTTIRVPKEELGKTAVKTMLERLSHKDKMIESIALDVSLVERDSVAQR